VTLNLVEPELEGLAPRTNWSRRGFVMTSLASGFALSVQPVSAETITTDAKGLVAGEVKVPVSDGTIPAYRAMPDPSSSFGAGPFPTVLVVQEIFGVHEHIKDLCRRFAKSGYYAIAAALYARQGDPAKYTEIPKLVSELVSKVPDAEVMSDLDATAAYAKSTGKADTSRLAVTGFCWGGRITWLYAAHNPSLKAAVAWYGPIDRQRTALQPKYPIDLAADLHCPVLGLYGAQDQSIPVDTVNKMAAACKAAAKTCEFKIYPDAPHGFNADYRPSYRAADAKDGWGRMLAWFKEHGAA
jgi:carboxymethylenebutenolidase